MIAADAVDRLIDARYLAASSAAVRYVRAKASHVLAEIGFSEADARGRSIEELAALLGVVRAASPALAWLIANRSDGQTPGEQALERAAQDLAAYAPLVGSSREMFDHVAERYPAVLRGQRSGLSILLKGEGLELWERYFSAANPLYDVHNQLTADGLRGVWRAATQRPRILELGTGTGGATAALLGALDCLPNVAAVDFVISDISPSFLVRVTERLRAPGRLRTLRIDFDRPLEEQGIPPCSIDVIVATNALHSARDLGTTLTLLRRAMASDAVLIVSESLCPAGSSVHQEFVFNLLGGSQASAGGSRFLSAARWVDLLQRAGFIAQVLVNQRGPELAMLAIGSQQPPRSGTSALAAT
jgi:SAM-dependent methyltransferase